MKNFEIEAWARRVIDRVLRGAQQEDSMVELKAKWPDPRRSARQLAGHANASAGSPILWLIGIDQQNGIVGTTNIEIGDWYAQLRAEFDGGVAPTLIGHPTFEIEQKSIVPLAFDTERPPYVVRNPDRDTPKSGPFSLDVPWRIGTNIRSATRGDLLQLLVPQTHIPAIELLAAEVWAGIRTDNEVAALHWTANATLYVTPKTGDSIVVPFHRCKSQISLKEVGESIRLSRITLEPPQMFRIREGRQNLSATIEATGDEVLIHGPGKVHFFASEYSPPLGIALNLDCELIIQMLQAGGDTPFGVAVPLSPAPDATVEKGHWKLSSA